MKIKDIGEFGLISRIRSRIKLYSKDVIAGIGDDAAVLKCNKSSYTLFTTDSLIEDVHFSLKHFNAEQIGMKAIEQNASDIAAMGGVPKFALVSLGLPENTDAEFVDRLYKGINKKSKKYKISIVGGNLHSSKNIAVNIAMIGAVEKKFLALRSGARINDMVFCSGNVGESPVGLELLKKRIHGKSIKKHLEPQARLNLSRKLVKVGINSMIDISDGIASEIRNICSESKVGARIYADKIPLSKNEINDAKKLKKDALDFGLYGGEDFELIFTAGKNKSKILKKYDVKAIGEIVDKKYGIKLAKNGKLVAFKKGYDHFRN